MNNGFGAGTDGQAIYDALLTALEELRTAFRRATQTYLDESDAYNARVGHDGADPAGRERLEGLLVTVTGLRSQVDGAETMLHAAQSVIQGRRNFILPATGSLDPGAGGGLNEP